MKRSLYLLALSVPLMMGATPPPARPSPQAESADVVQVNILDRFLQDSGVRPRQSSQKRRPARTQSGRGAIPKPPALANVPLPIPKPAEEAKVATEETPAPEQAQNTPPEPKAEDQVSQAEPEKADTVPTPEPQKPDEAVTPPAAQATTEDPAKAPVVEQPATATEPARQAEVPKPLAKPQTEETDKAVSDEPSKQEPVKPGEAEKGQAAKDEKKPDGKQAEEAETEKAETPPPPPLVEEDPEELKACLADLNAIGAKFEPTDPINEGNGCGIKHPIDVAEVLPGVDLGGATMRCKTALTMAHWLKDTVQPAMNIAMPGRKIVRLIPGSTYQCRLRNSASTGKLSEHARGNAFDVAAFKLDNGETIEMKPRDEDSTLEGAFQRTATAGACLHFSTVLSPGSDAAHETHLHLDILERTNGYRYCR